jgi:hypothetical protein
MGCDYYIYTVLKIVHTGSVSLIKLKEKPVYLYGWDYDEDDFTVHPLDRRPKIDHMKVDLPDALIYEKGKPCNDMHFDKYKELIEDFIKMNQDMDYHTKNKILIHNVFFEADTNGVGLNSFEDVDELYIVEMREWRP